MIERIVKNKKVSKCHNCGNDIKTDYKVKMKFSENGNSRYYHLTCYQNRTLQRIEGAKEILSEAHKSKRKLKKYQRYIILENLN